jgi:hypothetical protein
VRKLRFDVQAGAYSSYVSLGLMKYDFDHSGEDGAMKVAEIVRCAGHDQIGLFFFIFFSEPLR